MNRAESATYSYVDTVLERIAARETAVRKAATMIRNLVDDFGYFDTHRMLSLPKITWDEQVEPHVIAWVSLHDRNSTRVLKANIYDLSHKHNAFHSARLMLARGTYSAPAATVYMSPEDVHSYAGIPMDGQDLQALNADIKRYATSVHDQQSRLQATGPHSAALPSSTP
jgi:hypothetical protein